MLVLAFYQVWQAGTVAPGIRAVSGVVVAVDGPDIARVDRFSLRTAAGTTIVFDVETLALDMGGKPAPHLREHLASGEPIEVEYRLADDGRPVAVRYRDAAD